MTDTVARDPTGEFVAEVGEGIDRVLSALGEPKLSVLRTNTRIKEPVAPRGLWAGRTSAREAAATQTSACPTCHMVHTGECL